MTSYWHFYSLPIADIDRTVDSVRSIIATRDSDLWRSTVVSLRGGKIPSVICPSDTEFKLRRTATLREYVRGACLSEDTPPVFTDPVLQGLLREIALAAAEDHLVSHESRPGVRFVQLQVEDLDEDEELEYELLVHNIFGAGTTIAEPYGFLSGDGASSVGFLTLKTLSSLMRIEAHAGLLLRLSQDLQGSGDLLGKDLLALRCFLQSSLDAGLAVYYYEPGT